MKSCNSTLLKVILHTLVWIILFSLPILFFPGDISSFELILRMNWVFLFFAGIIFYLNYLALIDLFIFNKKTIWFIAINILLIAVFTWLNNLIIESGPAPFMFNDPGHFPSPGMNGPEGHSLDRFFRPDRNMFFIRNAGTYIIPVIISLTLKVLYRLKKTETEKKEIQTEHLQSELSHLKHQLHPHFFFNSLNNIYSLIDISPKKSKEAIHGLAKLVRYLLYETDGKWVKMSQEIDFLKQYVQLMKLRLNDNTTISCSFPEEPCDYIIAPLLFLPIIENAFKYGVSAKEKSEIKIELKINSGNAEFSSQNSYYKQDEPEKPEIGIGLENLKKRLNLLYPDKYTFTTEIANNIYKAHLSIKTIET
jgi:hypothetical protein